MTAATTKQIEYLLTLVNRANGTTYRFLSQARREIGLTSSRVKNLDKVECSRLIEEWIEKADR